MFFTGMKTKLTSPLEVEAITITGQHLTMMEVSGYIIVIRMGQ